MTSKKFQLTAPAFVFTKEFGLTEKTIFRLPRIKLGFQSDFDSSIPTINFSNATFLGSARDLSSIKDKSERFKNKLLPRDAPSGTIATGFYKYHATKISYVAQIEIKYCHFPQACSGLGASGRPLAVTRFQAFARSVLAYTASVDNELVERKNGTRWVLTGKTSVNTPPVVGRSPGDFPLRPLVLRELELPCHEPDLGDPYNEWQTLVTLEWSKKITA